MKKKMLLVSTLAILTMILLAACAGSEPSVTQVAIDETPDVTSAELAEATTDPTPEDLAESTPEDSIEQESRFMEIRYATGFSVEYIADDVRIVTDSDNRRILLVPRGQSVPSGFEEYIVIETPVQNALFGATTMIGAIRPFDIWESVGGVIALPEMSGAMDRDFEESGYDIVYFGSTMAPDFELIQLVNPDIAFVNTGDFPQSDLITMLDELDIPYVVHNGFMEPTHQGRLEYMQLIATFFDIDEEAAAFVEEEFAKLAELETIVAGVTDRPLVGMGLIHGGVVHVSGADSYVANQVRDAGGDWIFSHLGPDSTQLSMEEFFAVMADADLWIYPSRMLLHYYDALIALDPIVAEIPVVANRQVWEFHEDYWYLVDQLAQQVIDLAIIFHPDLFPGYEPFHYVPLN